MSAGTWRTTTWRRRLAALPLVVTLALGACTTADDEGDTPTPETGQTPTAAQVQLTPSVAATQPPATLSAANGNLITDGVCQALIPVGWVDDGTGRGTTSGGHRFVLFGGRVRDDAEWKAAADLVSTPAAGRTIASLDRADDSILAVFADNRGFEYRKRFGDRYCDFTVTSVSRPVAPEEQAYWPAVMDSLMPIQQ